MLHLYPRNITAICEQLEVKCQWPSLHLMPATAWPFDCSFNCRELNDMTFKQLHCSFISDIMFSMVFWSMHKLLQFSNTSTDALYDNVKLLQLQHYNSDVFWPFLMGHPQVVYTNICTEVLHEYWCTLLEDDPQERVDTCWSLSVLTLCRP